MVGGVEFWEVVVGRWRSGEAVGCSFDWLWLVRRWRRGEVAECSVGEVVVVWWRSEEVDE